VICLVGFESKKKAINFVGIEKKLKQRDYDALPVYSPENLRHRRVNVLIALTVLQNYAYPHDGFKSPVRTEFAGHRSQERACDAILRQTTRHIIRRMFWGFKYRPPSWLTCKIGIVTRHLPPRTSCHPSSGNHLVARLSSAIP